jgi:hypothetical protein
MTNWKELREKIHEAIGILGSLRNVEKAAEVGRLGRFMKGSRTDRPEGPEPTLDPVTERKVRACLQRLLNWPPAPTWEEIVGMFPSSPQKSERERFMEAADRDNLAFTSITWRGIEATSDDVTCHYRPEGGLDEADYRFFARTAYDDDERRLLAESVIVNLLRARGLKNHEAEHAADKLRLLDVEVEEIERIGFEALADEAQAFLRLETS